MDCLVIFGKQVTNAGGVDFPQNLVGSIIRPPPFLFSISTSTPFPSCLPSPPFPLPPPSAFLPPIPLPLSFHPQSLILPLP